MTEELLSSPLIWCSSGVPLRSHILYIDNGGTMWSSVIVDILKHPLCDTWHKHACAHTHTRTFTSHAVFHCSYHYWYTVNCAHPLHVTWALTHPSTVQTLCCMLCSLGQYSIGIYLYYSVLSQHLHWVYIGSLSCSVWVLDPPLPHHMRSSGGGLICCTYVAYIIMYVTI